MTGFAGDHEVADCTAIIVTYHSAGVIGTLLDTLPAAAAGVRVRVVVVDNDSGDDIAGVLARYPGVRLVQSGGNLGYAGGINVGRAHLGETRAVVILNPDLTLEPGALRRLHAALGIPGAGAAVPKFLDEDGEPYPSLRREPSLARAFGDALLGKRWPGRPTWLSEMVWSRAAYLAAAPVDWATGAVLMVTSEADAAVGAWDSETFFLYSEETDYARRLRDGGRQIRYVPDAVVRHTGGGSGTGPDLVALNTVNRVRYFRKYHGAPATAVFRGVVVLHELLRASRPAHRRALTAALRRSTWSTLPGPSRSTVDRSRSATEPAMAGVEESGAE